MAFFHHSNFMLQHEDHHHHHPPNLPSPNPQPFQGVESLFGKRSTLVKRKEEDNNNNGEEEELSDDGSQVGEKKRRLNMEQVKTLEKNFEVGNKLEPERKMQLARALGLQPRQIAIWFQNRRARWKTKKLERDYDLLKTQFQAIKAENHALQAHNQSLHAQILALKSKEPTESINLNKETAESCSNRSENSSEMKVGLESPNPLQPFFPSSLNRAQNMAQNPKEDNLCNMICGMDDHTGFWPWLDHHNFN